VVDIRADVPLDIERLRYVGQDHTRVVSLAKADAAGVQEVTLCGIPIGSGQIRLDARRGGRENPAEVVVGVSVTEVSIIQGENSEAIIYVDLAGHGGSISGVLPLPADVPASRVVVSAVPRASERIALRNAWPRSDGSFVLSGLLPGLYDVRAVGLSESGTSLFVWVNEDIKVDEANFIADRPSSRNHHSIRCMLEGRPFANRLLMVEFQGEPLSLRRLLAETLPTKTNDDGVMTCIGLPSGPYALLSLDGMHKGVADIRSGQLEVTIQMTAVR
jgi:hypothetical protein